MSNTQSYNVSVHSILVVALIQGLKKQVLTCPITVWVHSTEQYHREGLLIQIGSLGNSLENGKRITDGVCGPPTFVLYLLVLLTQCVHLPGLSQPPNRKFRVSLG